MYTFIYCVYIYIYIVIDCHLPVTSITANPKVPQICRSLRVRLRARVSLLSLPREQPQWQHGEMFWIPRDAAKLMCLHWCWPNLSDPPLPPTSIFEYFLMSDMAVVLIWLTALDSRRNWAAECISQTSFWDFSVLDILIVFVRYCILTPTWCICYILRPPRRRATKNHAIWWWDFV